MNTFIRKRDDINQSDTSFMGNFLLNMTLLREFFWIHEKAWEFVWKKKQQFEYTSGEMKAVLVSGQKMTLCHLRWIWKQTEW